MCPDLYFRSADAGDPIRITTSEVEEYEPDLQPIPARRVTVTSSLRHALRRAFLRAHLALNPAKVEGRCTSWPPSLT